MKKERKLFKKGLVLLAAGLLIGLLAGMTASAETKTIKPGRTYQSTKTGVNYHRISIPSYGYIGVQAYSITSSGAGTIKIGLLDSRKRPLETYYRNTTKSTEYTAYYGVKKGTYYIATKGSGRGYKIRYVFGAINEKSGSSQKSSKVLQQDTTRSGTLRIGESGSKSDWYKARIVNKSSFNFSVKTLTNGGNVAVQLLIPKYGINKTYLCQPGQTMTRRFRFEDNFGNPTGKRLTAMAYIRVYRYKNNAATSGAYSLKWK